MKTKIASSHIHGIGLFADQFIPKGTLIWVFTPGFDLKFTRKQILNFPDLLQIYICKYSWRSKTSRLYCFSSDNGKYFNHSNDPNCLSEYRNSKDEVVTTATRDIQKDEEITDNYSSFEDDKSEGNVLYELARRFHLQDELDPREKLTQKAGQKMKITHLHMEREGDCFDTYRPVSPRMFDMEVE